MAKGVNKVIIVGNLGGPPEMKSLPSGGYLTSLSVATGESWKDKDTGEAKEQTEWHRIVFFNKLAEIAGKYLQKGSKVYVEGTIKTRKWQDKDGKDRYITEIVGRELQMLDGKNGPAESVVNLMEPHHELYKKMEGDAIDKNSPQFDDDIPF